MRSLWGQFIFIVLILLIDVYIYQAVKTVSAAASTKSKIIILGIYVGITIFFIVSFLLVSYSLSLSIPKIVRTYLFAIVAGLFVTKIAIVFFIAIDDIRRLFVWIISKLQSNTTTAIDHGSDSINRSVFLSWIGLAAGGTLFGSLIYGFGNKYNYAIKKNQLAFENLPIGFKGLKIVHISDIHSGSFTDPDAVKHGVQKILDEKPDIILFTGDLVNDMASEMQEYVPIFSLLKAPMGIYSTLGNHDYGDYITWPRDGISKEENMTNLKKLYEIMGWRLLMNEHVTLERGGDKIALLGIENWSTKARFPKHGRMDLAHKGTEDFPFKILMSHDPSHWEGQIIPQYADVDLMLSGHTHGMQFGVSIPGFKWSPVQYMYKQWSGLYENEKQKLYVNPGFGFIGYPGRVGILPEITVIELV